MRIWVMTNVCIKGKVPGMVSRNLPCRCMWAGVRSSRLLLVFWAGTPQLSRQMAVLGPRKDLTGGTSVLLPTPWQQIVAQEVLLLFAVLCPLSSPQSRLCLWTGWVWKDRVNLFSHSEWQFQLMVSRDASRVKDQTVRGTFKLQAHGLKVVPGICLIPVKNLEILHKNLELWLLLKN